MIDYAETTNAQGFSMWDQLVEEPDPVIIRRNEFICIHELENCMFSCSTYDWTQHKLFNTNLILVELLKKEKDRILFLCTLKNDSVPGIAIFPIDQFIKPKFYKEN